MFFLHLDVEWVLLIIYFGRLSLELRRIPIGGQARVQKSNISFIVSLILNVSE